MNLQAISLVANGPSTSDLRHQRADADRGDFDRALYTSSARLGEAPDRPEPSSPGAKGAQEEAAGATGREESESSDDTPGRQGDAEAADTRPTDSEQGRVAADSSEHAKARLRQTPTLPGGGVAPPESGFTQPAGNEGAAVTAIPTAAGSGEKAQGSSSPTSGPAPLSQPADEDATNVARVVRGIANAVNQRGGSVTLRLQPPELGAVRVELHIVDGTVRATMQAEHDSVRNLLHHQIGQLRHALESHGLNVERILVQSMHEAEQQNAESPHDGKSRGAFSQQYEDETHPAPGEDEEDPSSEFAHVLNEVA